MTVLRSRLDPASEESLANVERMTALVAELRDRTVAVAGRGARIFYNQARMSAAGIPEFKRYLGTGSKRASDVLANLARYGTVYESFEHEPSATELGRFLYRLNTMEVTTAYPALLWLLGPDGIEDPTERQVALTGIESWLVRRMLTRQTTKNYNTVFLALLNRVRDNSRTRGSRPTGADVVEYLAGLTGESQYWPTAAGVRSSLRTLPAYMVFPRSRLRMVLEALEAGLYSGLTEKRRTGGGPGIPSSGLLPIPCRPLAQS